MMMRSEIVSARRGAGLRQRLVKVVQCEQYLHGWTNHGHCGGLQCVQYQLFFLGIILRVVAAKLINAYEKKLK